MPANPTQRKRASGVKKEVYGRLSIGRAIDPTALADELGCSYTAIARNCRDWEREGNSLYRQKNGKNLLSYVPNPKEIVVSPQAKKKVTPEKQPDKPSDGFLPLPQNLLPSIGELLQVSGLAIFNSGKITVVLRDNNGYSWSADITGQTV